jgi:hypothetical protein
VESRHARLQGPAQPSLRSVMPSMRVICTSKSDVSVATPIRPSPWKCEAAEVNAGSRTGAVHEMQGLLGGAGLSVQAEQPRGAPAHQDFGARSTINVVASRAVRPLGTIGRATH